MTQIAPFRGTKLQVKRKNGASFDLVCMASTKGLTKTNTFDDATVLDCDNPDLAMNRRSILKQKSWSIDISGIADGHGFAVLDGDCNSETPVTYQFVNTLPMAAGGGTYQGDVWYENLAITTSDNGVVNFKGQLRGEGPLVFTAATS